MALTFYDAFHGIGGFRYGLEQAGMICVAGCEIDKYACQAYGVINDERCEPTDIRTVDPIRLPDFDVFVGGFPCQDLSIAGNRKGFDGDRSVLFFEILRICRVKRPPYLLLENVDGLLSHNKGDTFQICLQSLDELGYDAEWQVHNSATYVPQNRERPFIIASLGGRSTRKIFPFGRENSQPIEVIGSLEGKGNDYVRRVYGIGGVAPTLSTMQGGGQEPKIMLAGMLDIKGSDQKRRVYHTEGIAPCLNGLGQGGLLEPKIVVAGQLESDTGGTGKVYDPEGIAPTQLAQHGNAVTKVIVNNDKLEFGGDTATCLDANYQKGFDNHGQRTGIMETKSSERIAGWVDREDKLFAYRNDEKRSTVQEHVYIKPEGITDTLTIGHVPKLIQEPRAVLTPDREEKRQNGRRFKELGEPMLTLTAQDKHGVAILDTKNGTYGKVNEYRVNAPTILANDYKEPKLVKRDGDYRIRKLTPLECFRLQSYPDWWYVKLKLFRRPELIKLVDMSRNDITVQVSELLATHKVKGGISDSQIYKMAGNGVTSEVARQIGIRLNN